MQRRKPLVAATGLLFTLATILSPLPAGATLSTTTYGWGPSNPDAIVASGSDLWIANSNGGYITETDESTGQLVRTLYGFYSVEALAISGPDLWVAGCADGGRALPALTQIDTDTGAVVQTITAKSDDLNCPDTLAVSGSSLWVGNYLSGSLVQLDAGSGAFIQEVVAPSDELENPISAAVAGNDLWIGTLDNGLVELNATTGAIVQVATGPSGNEQVCSPYGLAVADGNLWVTNDCVQYDGDGNIVSGGGLDEFDATTGAFEQFVSDDLSELCGPYLAVAVSNSVWVASSCAPEAEPPNPPASGGYASLTGFDGSTGDVVGTFTGPGYGSVSALGVDGDELFAAIASGACELTWQDRCSTNDILNIDTSDDKVVSHDQGSVYELSDPGNIAVVGSDLWIVSGAGSLDEVSATTGSLRSRVESKLGSDTSVSAVSASGGHLWAIAGENALDELSGATGHVLRIDKSKKYGLRPLSLVVAGDVVWVANTNRTLTEVNASTGALIRIVSGSKYGFLPGMDLADIGGHLWVGNSPDNGPGSPTPSSLTEINATSGALIRVLRAKKYEFDAPGPLAGFGDDVFACNGSAGTITEVNASTGRLVRVFAAPAGELESPSGAVVVNGTLWIAGYGDGASSTSSTLLSFNTATGQLEGVVPESMGIVGPVALAADGPDLWVVNALGHSLTEVAT